MKRKTAKEILADSFREIARNKTADKITVVDIVENCGYSTSTFYRHFRDKYDLMMWEYIRRFESSINGNPENEDEWKTVCLDGARFFSEQKEYLKNLLFHTSGMDLFSSSMKQIHFGILQNWLINTTSADRLDKKTVLYAQLYCYGIIGLTCDWIMGKYDVTAEELAEIYEKSLPYSLYEMLFHK